MRTALSEDGFSAHIACALSQQSALPMPPRAGVGGAVERARQFYQRAIEAARGRAPGRRVASAPPFTWRSPR